ncbi:hypothetical protein OKW45_000260 [Paraburkholderia sp. WSM4175]
MPLRRYLAMSQLVPRNDRVRLFQSPDYQRALNALEKSYFGKESRPNMPIASVAASLGAELLIEFDTVDVVTDLL